MTNINAIGAMTTESTLALYVNNAKAFILEYIEPLWDGEIKVYNEMIDAINHLYLTGGTISKVTFMVTLQLTGFYSDGRMMLPATKDVIKEVKKTSFFKRKFLMVMEEPPEIIRGQYQWTPILRRYVRV